MHLVFATQTLSRLDKLTTAQQVRDLRASVFSNLDGLFAFHTSAEDARYLAPELGGGLDEQDLLELGHFQCYARITDVRTSERFPAFTVRLAPPPPSDVGVVVELATRSAERYGRDALEVELDRQTAIARVDGGRRKQSESSSGETPSVLAWPTIMPGSGLLAADRTVVGAEIPNPRKSNSSSKKRIRSRKGQASRAPGTDASPEPSGLPSRPEISSSEPTDEQ